MNSLQSQFPVPVVRLILPDEHGRILLLKRGPGEYEPNLWCLPGGKVDYGKTVADAMRDELREETGLSCERYSFLFYQDSLPITSRGMHCINFYFECTWAGSVRLNRESFDFVWLPHDELANYVVAFKNDLALMKYWKEKGAI
jgi:8-oxo-dGTP diphosphatase